MRRLVLWLSAAALLWSAWWAVAAFGLQAGLAGWVDARRPEGWQAEAARIDVAGYPWSLKAGLTDVTLSHPARQLAVDAPRLDLQAPAHWPGFVTLDLPDAPLRLTTPAGEAVLRAEGAEATLRLRPGMALELERLGAQSGPWEITAEAGPLLSAADLQIDARQAGDDPATYHMTLAADALTPGAPLRTLLNLPSAWAQSFDVLAGDVLVTFDRPWDRTALNARAPRPREVTLQRAEAIWGPVAIMAEGALSIAPDGIPSGGVTLRIENWEPLLNMAEAAGLLPQSVRAQAELMLRALANMTSGAELLELDLSFADGNMALGGIDLGPAPRLFLP